MMSAETLKDHCNRLRGVIEDLKRDVHTIVTHGFTEEIGDEGEVRANAMLSFRHLEDAGAVSTLF